MRRAALCLAAAVALHALQDRLVAAPSVDRPDLLFVRSPSVMKRLSLGNELPCVPEISANKYALNVRFLLPEGVQKSRVYEQDVPFELAFCNL